MIENLKTFVNKNGLPIKRKCLNCKFWNSIPEEEERLTSGYCKLKPLYFAYTLQPTVFPITKHFYLCVEHKFKNEEFLEQNSSKVSIADAIKI